MKGADLTLTGALVDHARLGARLSTAMPSYARAEPYPHAVLDDFLDFNDFLGAADELLEQLGYDGTLQVASFHPRFQFAGTREDDISNATNRSPYPTLHLLREASVDRAVAAFPEPESIYEKNIRTLEALGSDGFAALQAQWKAAARK